MSGKLLAGTSGWSYKDWVGPFYPKATASADFLAFYAKKFQTVEIDSTFYRIPSTETVRKWFQITPENFIFSPKFPRVITHEKRLQNCSAELDKFLSVFSLLKHKLGPLVLQFEYSFTPEYFPQLADFLPQLPENYKFAVEVRNELWHKNVDFFDLLEKYHCALVMQDLYYMPKYFRITAPFTFIRLLGNRKQIPDDFSHARIDREDALNDWARRTLEMVSEGIDVYIYSNNRYQGFAPATVTNLNAKIQKLKKV